MKPIYLRGFPPATIFDLAHPDWLSMAFVIKSDLEGSKEVKTFRLVGIMADDTPDAEVVSRAIDRAPAQQRLMLALEWSLHLDHDPPDAPSHCPRCRAQRPAHRLCDLDTELGHVGLFDQDMRDRARAEIEDAKAKAKHADTIVVNQVE